MRAPRLAAVGLGLGLLLGLFADTSYASGREVQQYQAPEEVNQEAIAAAKERARTGGITDFDKGVTADTEPVPWMLIGLVVIIFAGVAPFAWRAYKNTAAEVAGHGPRSGRVQNDE